MVTFSRLIAETIFAGAETSHGYVEIFVDPTGKELRIGKAYSESQLEFAPPIKHLEQQGFVPPFHYMGGIISDTQWFVFDRERATHHDILKELVAENVPKKLIPIYVWHYLKEPRHLFIQAAKWSMHSPYAQAVDDQKLKTLVRTHPKLKAYTVMVVNA